MVEDKITDPAGNPWTIKRVDSLVRFYVAMPDDELAADRKRDEIGDAIKAKVNDLAEHGIFDESVSIVGWTELSEAEVKALEGDA